MNLTESASRFVARLKDGREIHLDHVEDNEDDLECLGVYAVLDGVTIGSGKYDVDEGCFRGVDVRKEFRRLGVATAMYDYVKNMGFSVRPSPYLEPDGQAFWSTRKK